MRTTRDYERALADAAEHLAHVLGTGQDGSVRSPFARASRNLSDRAAKGMPGRSSITGTRSSQHRDLSGRVADALDAGRSAAFDAAARDHIQLVRTALELVDAARRLRRLVDAATLTVDRDTAARATSLDECRLCDAVGYHSVVYARGLCSWCWRLSQRLGTDAEGRPIDPHTDLVRAHNEGRRVHDSLIARYHPQVVERVGVACGHPVWTDAGERPCVLPAMHGGVCAA